MTTQKYFDLLKLFPHFKDPCVIAVARLKDSQKPDPEDSYAAEAILKCLVDIQGNAEKVKIGYVPSIGDIEDDKHLISFGGWVAPNKSISYLPSYSKNMPQRELYPNIDPEMAEKKVIRRFLGEPKIKSMRAIWDRRLGVNGKLSIDTDNDGWLTKDYLLISTFHLKCLVPSADKSLFITSFEGLYGSGTMAVELFFRDFDRKLKGSIFKAIGNSRCFQIACSVSEISHSGDFSYANEIDFARACAIVDPYEFTVGNNAMVSSQLGPSHYGKQVANKETIKEKKEYELLYSGKKRKLISSEEAEELRKRKGQKARNEIFIDDERTEVFFNKKRINEFQGQSYSLLCHFVENEGIGGSKMNIYECVWRENPNSDDYETMSGAFDAALTRFKKVLKKHGIGKIPINKEGVGGTRKVYLLEPKRTYCILRKIEN